MQIPSVQLDSVAESFDDVFVANRNPQPGEVQIPLDADIEFDIFGPATDLEISVDGVWVHDAGTFQNDWSGALSPGPGGATHVVLQSPQHFSSGQQVRVRIYQGNRARFTTWYFVAYDLTAPLIRHVQASAANQIKVTFNENVTMVDPTAPGDALNPQSYFIERASRPAVTPSVVQVDSSSPTEVVLTTDLELTFGANYMIVVTGVSDEFGNLFEVPHNTAEFDGWLPPYPNGRRFRLHEMVPRLSIAEDVTDDLKLFLGCIQDSTNLLLWSVDKWVEIFDPDTAPEDFVDAILIDLGNPFTFELTLPQKRRLAKVLLEIYKLKGTIPGIVQVTRLFLGIEVSIETFTGRGWRLGYDQLSRTPQLLANKPAIIGPSGRALYSFRVLTDVVLTETQRTQLLSIANYMKGAQEHVVGIKDGSPEPIKYVYWTLSKTKIGYVKVARGSTLPPAKSSTKDIIGFRLATP